MAETVKKKKDKTLKQKQIPGATMEKAIKSIKIRLEIEREREVEKLSLLGMYIYGF